MPTECSDEQEALKPQSHKRKKKRLREEKNEPVIKLSLREVEEYCKDCVEWKEVKPILYFLEALLPRDGPKEVKDTIKRIKKEFKNRIYGHQIKAKKVVMQNPYIKGPLNSFKHNNKIEFGNNL